MAVDNEGGMMDGDTLTIASITIDQSPTLGGFFAALAVAQGAMAPAKMDSRNPHFGSSYASLDSIIESIRGPLSTNGLAYVQRLMQSNGEITMVTTLGHSSGEWMQSTVKLILSSVGRPGDPITMQALGSAITYARRYGLAAITGAVSDADDDGNEASDAKPKRETAHLPTVAGSEHICPVHKVIFKRMEKDGKVWYSHKDGERWCNEDKVKPQEPAPGLEHFDDAPSAPEKVQSAGQGNANGEITAEVNAILALREQTPITPKNFQARCKTDYGESDLFKLTAEQRAEVKGRLEKVIKEAEKTA